MTRLTGPRDKNSWLLNNPASNCLTINSNTSLIHRKESFIRTESSLYPE